MSGEDDPMSPGDPRTVFVPPSTSTTTSPATAAAPDRTVFEPEGGRAAHVGAIRTGDVLNNMFEVRRAVARGGMGEVFEGANVITDERVAIKVILPQLAADPHVISLFHREARTLTHLHHEAVVQYRVLAQEPRLGVLYIVTEYIDGISLAEMLGTVRPDAPALSALLRRLASGLRAAHALGAIHRDIAPDNVLLAGGELARAKIIDFGIAKDLDPGTATIVGDGFAGKLGYVAPEQLGDFGRRLGPWTDVYSLGLVMLAVAAGRDIGMGGSLVDAVDKRRAGPDLSVAPPELRALLEKMTRADPDRRLASMDAVLAELDGAGARSHAAGMPRARPRWAVPAAAAAAVAVLAALLLALWPRPGPDRVGPVATRVAGDAVAAARDSIGATLPSVNCTWLRVLDVTRRGGGGGGGGSGVRVRLTGVAGDPSAAQSEITRSLQAAHVASADLDFAEVSPITPPGCAVLDAYRQVRAGEAGRLSVPQRKFEMRTQPAGTAYAGERAAEAVVDIAVGSPGLDFTLVGLEPSGQMTVLFANRAALARQVAASTHGVPLTALPGDRYRLTLDLDHGGWSGLLLLTGRGPFDAATVAPRLGARGPDWRDRLVSLAAARDWQADMVWFKSVDEVKD
ncbi:MAG: protein kinase domain-containing protein [Janthinobacterium lividum]